MFTTAEELAAQAIALSAADRTRLVGILLASAPDEEDATTEVAWDQEIEQRLHAIASGQAHLVPASEVHAQARKFYQRRERYVISTRHVAAFGGAMAFNGGGLTPARQARFVQWLLPPSGFASDHRCRRSSRVEAWMQAHENRSECVPLRTKTTKPLLPESSSV